MALDMNAAVKITASVNGQQAIDQLRTGIDKLSSSAAAFGKVAGVAFVVIQSAQAVAQFAASVINAADDLKDMAAKTGLTVEQLSELDYAARTSGTSIDAVASAMGILAKKATDAATGSKSAKDTFNALGITVKDSNGTMKTQLQLFEEVAAVLNGVSDATLKAALAREIFGKAGTSLIPFINDMEEARDTARELGLVVGTDFANSADQFNDNMTTMSALAGNLARTILNSVVPAMNKMMTEMTVGIKVFGSFGSALYNIGTTNPFSTLQEQAKKYNDQVNTIQQSIAKHEKSNSMLDMFNLRRLRSDLVEAQKLAEYFNTMVQLQTPSDAGQSFPTKGNDASAQAILANLSKANTETVKLTDAQKEAKRAEEERAAILRNLSDEIFKLSQGEQQLAVVKMMRLGATNAEIDQLKTLLQRQQTLKSSAEAAEEAERNKQRAIEDAISAGQKKNEALAESGKRVFESVRTPLEIYNAELVRLNDLLDQGAISQDTFGRAAAKANQDLADAGKKNNDNFKDLEMAMNGFGRQATDAFVDMAFGAKASFSDLASSVLKDIARMIVQMMVMKPLMKMIGGSFGFADGGVFEGGSVKAFANGGVVNQPTFFPMANGTGLMGEAGPEAIMPLQRTSSGKLGVIAQGGGGQTNNVTVNVSVSGQESSKSDSNTGAALGMMISKVVQSELLRQKRPGGLLAA